jgi:hypothetical protein
MGVHEYLSMIQTSSFEHRINQSSRNSESPVIVRDGQRSNVEMVSGSPPRSLHGFGITYQSRDLHELGGSQP